jgi:uncharacterized low-complexity protein
MNNRNFKDLIMKYSTAKPLAAVLGAAFVAAMAQVPATQAAENPFATTELQGGYKVAAQHEGKCGEGKCGEGHKSASEGKCGEGKSMKTSGEGKCGEGKCGG